MADNLRKYTTQEVLNKVYTDSSGDTIGLQAQTSKETLNAVLNTSTNSLNVSLSGSNTISGDVTITGDLTVQGGGSLTFDEIIEGSLNVKQGSAGSITVPTVADDLVVENNDHAGISILTPDDKLGTIGFGSPSDAIAGMVRFDETNKTMIFGTVEGTSAGNIKLITANEVTAMTIDSSQNSTFAGNVEIISSSNSNTKLLIENNHASANALLQIDSSNDRDSVIQLLENGTTKWDIRNDGDDSDKLKISDDGDVRLTLSQTGSTTIFGNQFIEGTDAFLQFHDTGETASAGSGVHTILSADDKLKFMGRNDDASAHVDGFSLLRTGSVQFHQNVGIGDTPHASRKLVITGTNTTNATAAFYTNAVHTGTSDDAVFSVRSDNASASGTVLNIQNDGSGACLNINSNGSGHALIADGKVGIGLTDPNSTFMVGGSTSSGGDIAIANTGTNLTTLSTLGSLLFKGKDDSVSSYGIGAKIVAKCTETWNEGTSEGTKLEFHSTVDGASLNTLNMVLDGNSRISLGNNDSSGATSNTIFGRLAGNSVTTGAIDNVLIGNEAGNDVTTGDYLVAIGSHALHAEDVGRSSIAIGAAALGSQNTVSEGSANTIGIGTNAGHYNVTGTANVHIGHNSGLGTDGQSGSNITAVGHEALKVAYGQDNVAVGAQAGLAITSGVRNCLIGNNTGDSITDANYVTAVGIFAGSAINHTDASGTTLLGYSAGLNITSGGKNVAIGHIAGSSITTGDSNVAIGHNAMDELVDGNRNIAIGHNAMGNVVGGTTSDGSSDNIFIGYQSGGGAWTNNVCSQNIGIGSYTLDEALDSADFNTTVGVYGLSNVSSGSNNTTLGRESGTVITTGSNNTCIGYDAEPSANSASNQTIIGANATGQGDNTVTLGNADVTDVYMAQDSQAIVHAQNVPNHVANTMSSPYYRFDGTDDSINLGSDAILDNIWDNGGSVSGWIYPMSDGEGDNGRILDKAQWILNLTAESGGKTKMRFYIVTDSTDGYWDTPVQIENEKWTHFALVYDSSSTSNNPTMYLNGVSVTVTEVGTPNDTRTSDASSSLYIGADSGGTRTFDGSIAGIQIRNHELTATEVKELYSGASVPFKYKGASQTDMVTNGGFSSGSNWTISGGWDINTTTAGKARFLKDGSGIDYIEQDVGLVKGKMYRITFTISDATNAQLAIYNNSTANYASIKNSSPSFANFTNTANGTYVVDFLATANGKLVIAGHQNSGSAWDIDDVSLVPIGAVAEYDGSGIASDKWFDKSGNDLHGTVSGATVENAPTGDDGLVYEEGSHEPTITGSTSGSMGMNGSFNELAYTRVGRNCTVTGLLYITSDSSISGNIQISLPFTCAQENDSSDLAYGACQLGGTNTAINGTPVMRAQGTNSFVVIFVTPNDGGNAYELTHAEVDDNWFLGFTITYMVA